eukprot:318824-Amphidinium_carterae.1
MDCLSSSSGYQVISLQFARTVEVCKSVAKVLDICLSAMLHFSLLCSSCSNALEAQFSLSKEGILQDFQTTSLDIELLEIRQQGAVATRLIA